MEAITLAQLLEAVHGTLLGDFRDENVIVQRVDTDSRTIHPGSLFIPLVGERFDGHAYINAALEGGALGCLTARADSISRWPAPSGPCGTWPHGTRPDSPSPSSP